MASAELCLDRYLDDIDTKWALEDFVESQMIKYKHEAIKLFFSFTHTLVYAEQTAVTIAFGYREQLPEAVEIVEGLGLEEKHILALLGKEDLFRKIIEKESDAAFQEHLYATLYY